MLTMHQYIQLKFLTEEFNFSHHQAKFIINENILADVARKLASKYMLPAVVVMSLLSGQGCANKDSCPTPQVQQQIQQDAKQELQNYPAQNVQNQQNSKELKNYSWQSPDEQKYSGDDDTPQVNNPPIQKQKNNKELKNQSWRSPDLDDSSDSVVAPGGQDNSGKVAPSDGGKVVAPGITMVGANKYRVQGIGRVSRIGGPNYAFNRAKQDAQMKLMKYLKVNNATFKFTQAIDQQKLPNAIKITYEITVE